MREFPAQFARASLKHSVVVGADGGQQISRAICAGLIEATPRRLRSCQRRRISRAICAGLIEAVETFSNNWVRVVISRAICAGLIEAAGR